MPICAELFGQADEYRQPPQLKEQLSEASACRLRFILPIYLAMTVSSCTGIARGVDAGGRSLA